VLSKGDAVGQPTLRSWLLDDPNAVFSPGKEAEGKKEKKGTCEREKTLDGADIVRDGWLLVGTSSIQPQRSGGPIRAKNGLRSPDVGASLEF
jgi:hypothetical protein